MNPNSPPRGLCEGNYSNHTIHTTLEKRSRCSASLHDEVGRIRHLDELDIFFFDIGDGSKGVARRLAQRLTSPSALQRVAVRIEHLVLLLDELLRLARVGLDEHIERENPERASRRDQSCTR